MRKIWFLLIVLLGVSALFIAACGDDDENTITDPDQAEWILTFFQIPPQIGRASFMFDAYWNGEVTAIAASDTFNLTLDGVDVPVEAYNYDNQWFVSAYDFVMEPGTYYEVKFFKNGTQILSKTVKTCYEATATLPASFDPTQPVTLNWAVANNNQTQIVSVAAANWNAEPTSYDEEHYSVSNATRTYPIPANAVQYLGVGTEYELSILEYNNYFAGMNYVTTSQGVGNYYETRIKGVMNRIDRALKLAM